MKIKIIFFLLTSLSVNTLFGQDRVNRETQTFVKTSDTLTSATGWAYSEEYGEWLDYPNTLDNKKIYRNKDKQEINPFQMSTNEDFIRIFTNSLNYNNQEYYVTVIEYWGGEYKYPALKQDWIKAKRTMGYIFLPEEFNKLKNIDSLVHVKALSVVSSPTSYYQDEIIRKVTAKLDEVTSNQDKKKNKSEGDYIFPVMKATDGSIRFLLPTYAHEKKNEKKKKKKDKNKNEPEPTFYDVNFEKEYFETTLENFSKIFIK